VADQGGVIDIGRLHPGADPTPAPTPSGAVGLLVSADEPAVAGACPVQPDIIEQAGHDRRTRRVRALSGVLRTSHLESRGRAFYTLRWTDPGDAEIASLEAFFRLTTRGGELGFTVPVTAAGETPLALRQLADLDGPVQSDLGAYVATLQCESLHEGS